MDFHSFFYTSKDEQLYGLALPASTIKVMTKVMEAGLKPISPEKYWLSYAPFMMHHAPSGYIAWNGNSYWCVYLPAKDKNHKFVEGSNGIHLLEFSATKTIRYAYVKSTKSELPKSLYDLVYIPWDWHLNDEGHDQAFKLSPEHCKKIEENLAFSQEVHEEYAEKMPPEKYWDGFDDA